MSHCHLEVRRLPCTDTDSTHNGHKVGAWIHGQCCWPCHGRVPVQIQLKPVSIKGGYNVTDNFCKTQMKMKTENQNVIKVSKCPNLRPLKGPSLRLEAPHYSQFDTTALDSPSGSEEKDKEPIPGEKRRLGTDRRALDVSSTVKTVTTFHLYSKNLNPTVFPRETL